ncbi:hypothetical protein F5Y18DRAFT_368455 [Xylariaceae sp. FL1019]|nr:hypothetical protein F5Y18DRAFT_368455 [Xylariaceae sp. FL1019]
MPVKNIIILGAGPCGLATAMALAKQSTAASPLRIKLIEIRPELATIGGTLNVTPLCLRYLDYLGVGDRLRAGGISLDSGLDCVSMRTGRRIGNIWGGIGGIRSVRHSLVETLLQTVVEDYGNLIEIHWGARVADIFESEVEDVVKVKFQDGSELTADILVGADGLHSTARRMHVEPERQDSFTGRVITMGFHEPDSEGKKQKQALTLADSTPLLRDTAVITTREGMLLASYYEPSRTKTYFAHISHAEEPQGDARDGWRVLGSDQARVKREIVEAYRQGSIKGLPEVLAQCDDWHLYPVYMLPGGGKWFRGRVIILGDAAHAMPPQGESTGIAIEDGVLLAHVFSRRETRSVSQLFADYEALRRPVIDKHFEDSVWAMKHGFAKRSWLGAILMEWAMWVYLSLRRWSQESHFAGDVRELELPA